MYRKPVSTWFSAALGNITTAGQTAGVIPLVLVCWALSFDYLVYGVMITLTPASPAGISDDRQEAIASCSYAFGCLLFAATTGVLGRRVSCPVLMIAGAMLRVLAMHLMGTATTLPDFHAGRFVLGGASSMTWVGGLTFIVRHHPHTCLTVIGAAMISANAAIALGPSLASAVHRALGYGTTCLAFSIGSMVTGALLAFLIRKDRLVPRQQCLLSQGTRDGETRQAWHRAFTLPSLAVAAQAAGWTIVETLTPMRVLHSQDASLGAIGTVFTVGILLSVLAFPLVAWLTRGVPDRILIIRALATMAILIFFFDHCRQLLALICLVTAQCLSATLVWTRAIHWASVADAGHAESARAQSAQNVAYAIGALTVTLLISLLLPLLDRPALSCMLSITVLLPAFIIWKAA